MIRLGASLLFFSLTWASAAEPAMQVTVVGSKPSRDQKRTAYKLRISVQQLKNARSALKDATKLARGMDPFPIQQTLDLERYWIQLHPTKASDTIESFLADLRLLAKESSDEKEYSHFTLAAQRLLSELVKIDEKKAFDLAEKWPTAKDVSKAVDIRTRMREELTKRHLQVQLQYHPDVLSTNTSLEELDGMTYSSRATLAQNMIRGGNNYGATELVLSSIEKFSHATPDPQMLYDYARFLTSLSKMDYELFQKGFATFRDYVYQYANVLPVDQVRVNDMSISVNSGELAILTVLERMTHSMPERTLTVLTSCPSLKAKLDTVGGIDGYLGRSRGQENTVPIRRQLSYQHVTRFSATSESVTRSSDLIEELKGKAKSNPFMVRGILSRRTTDAADIDALIVIAKRVGWKDPDLATIALEVAADNLDLIDSFAEQSQELMSLIRTYRWVNGEVETKVLKKGFLLVTLMRDEEDQDVAARSPQERYQSTADSLEAYLVAETALYNYDSAITYVQSIPKGMARLNVLLQVIETLRGSRIMFW